MSNNYTDIDARRAQNQWRTTTYSSSVKEADDTVARKNAEKAEEERRRKEEERRRKEEERRRREAERRRKEEERRRREEERKRKEEERRRREAEQEAKRLRKEAEREAERLRREEERKRQEAEKQEKEMQKKYEREQRIAQKRQEQIDAQNRYSSTPSAIGSASVSKKPANDKNNATAPPSSVQNPWKSNAFPTGNIKSDSSTTKFEIRSPVSVNQEYGNNRIVYNTKTTNSNSLLNQSDVDSFIEKYLPRLTGEDKTTKSYGPNAETGRQILNAQNYPTEFNTNVYGSKNYTNGGVSGEIARYTFIAPQDKTIVQKISDDIYNARYGMDGLNEVNHTNTLVTKDSVYSMPANEVADKLNKAQTNVRNLRSDKKQQRDEILFKKHLLQAEGYGEEKTAELDEQINQLDNEIKMLNIRDIKANVGYEFCQTYINQLSEANGDDILKIINEYNHLPYFGNIADNVRSAKSGVDKVSDVVSVLENTKINSINNSDYFQIFNINSPQNSFTVKPDYKVDPYGFRDYRLSVTADNVDALTPDQKNLYKALDDMPISEKTYDFLDKLPKILNNFDAEKTGRGLTAIGYGLDVFDFLCLVATDYDSSTETVSKDATRKVTSMITSWIGGLAGAELGVASGAAIGTAILPGVGTVIGGAIGAVVGAYVLSELGEDAGMYIGGLDYGPGNPIEYHLERGR